MMQPQQPTNPDGNAALIRVRFQATNENAMRFMYDVVNDPCYYRIEAVDIYAPEKGELVTVDLTVEILLTVTLVSTPVDGLTHPKTGEPLAVIGKTPDIQTPEEKQKRNIGKETLAAVKAERKKRGLDMTEAINAALVEVKLEPLGEDDGI
jgi:hypothetical protein